ncbi:hypothetical protein QBC42DRAFT_247989 [Cladorrhinum samala]|uniref:Uncharacterized protein n=1 Tax=Cladorrhinum samala TaxID=585594 RepID=A0AAV9HZ25_9PEZI|nr:hypothetical protein QBC42DRAFT_247989 [Cladorrhinum samala]
MNFGRHHPQGQPSQDTPRETQAQAGPTSSVPRQVSPTVSTTDPEADEVRLGTEMADLLRDDIDRILTRGPISPERTEELSIAAKEFYLQAMERKRSRRRKEWAMCAGVVMLGVVTWRLLR